MLSIVFCSVGFKIATLECLFIENHSFYKKLLLKLNVILVINLVVFLLSIKCIIFIQKYNQF